MKGAIKNNGAGADAAAIHAWEQRQQVTFKHRTPLIDGMSEINNKQADIWEDINIVVLMYNLIAYNKNYETTSKQE